MPSLVDYLNKTQLTFAEKPFGEADSLVLSSICYLDFQQAESIPQIAMGTLASAELNPEEAAAEEGALLHDLIMLADGESLVTSGWMRKSEQTDDFINALSRSRRYRDVRFCFYVEDFSEAVDKQFCAVTYLIDDGTSDGLAYLAFRGTDGTITGWKEDFNLSFMDVTAGHQSALAYASGVASALPCKLLLGGHSKGGNLAEYAAATVDETVFARIDGIFNHDGPAFMKDPSPRFSSPAFRTKRHKSIPTASVFGMVMEEGDDYEVVESSAAGFAQHDPLTWYVSGDSFINHDQIDGGAALFSNALNSWVNSKTPEERKLFLSTIFDVVETTNATTWAEIKKNPAEHISTLVQESVRVDASTRAFMIRTLAGLPQALRDETATRLRDYLDEWNSQV